MGIAVLPAALMELKARGGGVMQFNDQAHTITAAMVPIGGSHIGARHSGSHPLLMECATKHVRSNQQRGRCHHEDRAPIEIGFDGSPYPFTHHVKNSGRQREVRRMPGRIGAFTSREDL